MRVYPEVWSLPYGKSRLTFFVGQVEAQIVAGEYVFDGVARDFITRIPLVAQSVYFFMDFDFSVDVPQASYTGSIGKMPVLSLNERSRPTDSIFRQPLPVPVYYRNKWILQGYQNLIQPNELQFKIEGTILQTAPLVGTPSLTATVQFTAYEVIDQEWVKRFQDGLSVQDPKPGNEIDAPPGAMRDLARLKAEHPQIDMGGGLSLPAGVPSR